MHKEIKIHFELFKSIDELNQCEQDLFEKAESAMLNAYAPYSKFKVGAACLLTNGEVVLGNNQENIAYPSGLCAERVAIFSANANFPKENIEKIVIVAQGDLVDQSSLLSPCGSCRQVMSEVKLKQKSDFDILLRNFDGSIMKFRRVEDILPFSFGNIFDL